MSGCSTGGGSANLPQGDHSHDGLISRPAADASTYIQGPTSSMAGAPPCCPVLIDTHVHVDTVAHLEASAGWGVTTVLDMGHENAAHLETLQHRPGLPTLKMAGSPCERSQLDVCQKNGSSAERDRRLLPTMPLVSSANGSARTLTTSRFSSMTRTSPGSKSLV